MQGFTAAVRDIGVLSPFALQLELIKGLPEAPLPEAPGEPLLNEAVFGIGNAAEVCVHDLLWRGLALTCSDCPWVRDIRILQIAVTKNARVGNLFTHD
jgi:hypothetical protein